MSQKKKPPYITCYYHEYNPNKNLVFTAVMLKVAFQAYNFIHYKFSLILASSPQSFKRKAEYDLEQTYRRLVWWVQVGAQPLRRRTEQELLPCCGLWLEGLMDAAERLFQTGWPAVTIWEGEGMSQEGELKGA